MKRDDGNNTPQWQTVATKATIMIDFYRSQMTKQIFILADVRARGWEIWVCWGFEYTNNHVSYDTIYRLNDHSCVPPYIIACSQCSPLDPFTCHKNACMYTTNHRPLHSQLNGYVDILPTWIKAIAIDFLLFFTKTNCTDRKSLAVFADEIDLMIHNKVSSQFILRIGCSSEYTGYLPPVGHSCYILCIDNNKRRSLWQK